MVTDELFCDDVRFSNLEEGRPKRADQIRIGTFQDAFDIVRWDGQDWVMGRSGAVGMNSQRGLNFWIIEVQSTKWKKMPNRPGHVG